jgi:hypothetical protein
MKTLIPTIDGARLRSFGERTPTVGSADYTADMLHRTTESPVSPEGVGYLVVERLARTAILSIVCAHLLQIAKEI